MARTRQLYVALTLQAESYNNALRNAQRETREFERMIRPTMKTVEDLGKTMRTVGIGLTASLTAPILAVAGLGIQFNAMQEQAQIAFTTMLGSGQKARAFLEELKEFAAKTPFEFPDLVRASQRLLAMGFAAEQIKPLLTTVGDAAAGLGGGADAINRITLALGQMAGRGRIATQEMNQLTEVGIPAWRILAQGMGVTEQRLRDMVEKGLVPAGKSIEILQKGMDQAFGGMMQKQAETFSGLLSTIKDEARFIAGDLTTGLFNLIRGPLKQAAEMLGGIRDTIRGMSDESKALFAVIAGGLAAIGPALILASLSINAISTTIKTIAGLRGALFAAVEVIAGVGAIRSIGEARLAMELYAASIWAVHGAWIAAAAQIGAYLLLAYEIWNLGNAVADYVQAQKDLDQSQKDLQASTKTLEDRLRSQGVTVERGTKSLLEYNDALRKAGQMKWEDPFLPLIQQGLANIEKDIVERERKRKEAAAERALAAEKEQKEIARLTEAYQKALKPADALNAELLKLGGSLKKMELLKVYGEDALKATLEQEKHGKAVHGLVLELSHLQMKMESIKQANEAFTEMQLAARDATEKTVDGTIAAIKKIDALIDKKNTLKIGDDIEFFSALALQNFGNAKQSADALLSTLDRLRGNMPKIPWSSALTETTTRVQMATRKFDELGKAITELSGIGYTDAQIMAHLGSEINAAGKDADLFGVKISESTKRLYDQIEAAEKSAKEAKRWQEVWSQVMGNIVTDFARGLTDVIFRAKSFAGALADVGKTAGKAFMQAFFAELFNPLTQMLASWGRQLAGVFQTQVFPKLAGALGLGSIIPKAAGTAAASTAGGAAASASAGGGMFGGLSAAKMGAFLSNPITIGVGAVIGGVIAATKLIGRGREQADNFGNQIERPFGMELASLLSQFHSQQAAGTLTLATATAFRDDAAALIRGYNSQAAAFAAQGDQQRKVVEQATIGKAETFGENFSRIFNELNTAIANVKGSPSGSALPEVGRSFSAANVFADAVDVFKKAVEDAPVSGGAQAPSIEFHEGDIQITITGTNKSPQEIAEELNETLRTNRRGVLEELIRLLESGGASVATA